MMADGLPDPIAVALEVAGIFDRLAAELARVLAVDVIAGVDGDRRFMRRSAESRL